MKLSTLYANRFSDEDYFKKNLIWQSLCRNFFEKSRGGSIKPEDDILDVAAGHCEFINNIGQSSNANHIGRRIAVDLNEDAKKYASENVEYFNEPAQDLSFLKDNSLDVVFISNFFEHIQDKADILKIIQECKRVLRQNGKLLILQPNIKYIKGAYWDFFDHYTPLTEKSMAEAINLVGGFEMLKCYDKFLPYTTKSCIPQHPLLVKLYCMVPVAWKLMGKQMYIVALKK